MKRRVSREKERKRRSGREIVKRPEAKRNEQSSSAATPTFFPAVRPIFPRVNRPMARSVFRKRSSATRYHFFSTEMRYTIFVKYILNNEFFFLIECN